MTKEKIITGVAVPIICAVIGVVGGATGHALYISQQYSEINNKIINLLNIDADNVSVSVHTNMDSLIEAFEVTQQELVNQKGQTESLQSNYQRSKDEAASLREENKSLSNENKKIKDFLLKDGVYIDDIDDLVTVKQTTDKLSDLYLIDSEGYSVVDAVRDLYGDVHSVSYKFHPFYTAFARYRLGGNYDLFEANIATSQETGGDVHISIEVYVDGNIVKRVDDITRDTNLVPLGPIQVRNGSVLEIKVLSIEGNAQWGGYCYITDDRLSVI